MPSGGGRSADLGGFVGINRAEFAIDLGELVFQLVLLVENLLASGMQSLALAGNKVGEGFLGHRPLLNS
ncbi:hypothetical protein D3C83_263200 [compost metagenome]